MEWIGDGDKRPNSLDGVRKASNNVCKNNCIIELSGEHC